MVIEYRDARKEDCPQIAEYINDASDGILDYIFKDNAAGMTVPQILAYNLEHEERYNSYKSVIVAEYKQELVGIVQSYSPVYHRIDDEMRSFFSKERLMQFQEFHDLRVENSLLIKAMFVEPNFRCQGIGTKFLSLAKAKAESLCIDKLSLDVLADNINTQQVYYPFGNVRKSD